MDSKPVLYFDIIRDILTNFDRKTLCRLQIVNKRFNLIIEKEFNNSPPYLVMPKLQYKNNQWTIEFENELIVHVDSTVLQKIIALKFIRFYCLRAFCNENYHPMQLLDMSHVWENGYLSVIWIDVQGFHPTEEFSRSLSNCSELYVRGSNAISMIHPKILGNYHHLDLYHENYDPVSHKVPWKKITDYLFRAVKNSDFSIYITTDRPPDRKKTMEFINSVYERFQVTDFFLNFTFYWWASYKEWTFPEIDIQNNHTKQRLKLLSCSTSFLITAY